MSKTNYDVLIVGQGIVGTVLAHTLIKYGKSVLIIDDPKLSSSSSVSAGLFNPVVFKRLTESWMVDELIDSLVPFYNDVEKLLGEKLLFEKEIVRIFSEDQERVLWEKKRNEKVGKYLSPPILEESLHYGEDVSWGVGVVRKGGNMDVQKFLSLSLKYFLDKKVMIEEKFDHNKLEILNDGISYHKIEAKKIIFCEGYLGATNPFFNWIPFKPAKGELLTVRIKKYPLRVIISKGVFILPLGNELFRVGSTFVWDKINDYITEEGKNKLVESLKKIVSDFEIIDHKAGVRPSISDRRPVLGMHPEHNSICIFNGMGSKGVMLSPYFAEHLYKHLYEGKELNREVDVGRFVKK